MAGPSTCQYLHIDANTNYYYISAIVSAPPPQPIVNVSSKTAASISLSWSVPSAAEVTSSEVIWREASSDHGSRDGSSSYDVQDLDNTTIYAVSVTVTNEVGSTVSQPVFISLGTHTCNIDSWYSNRESVGYVGIARMHADMS